MGDALINLRGESIADRTITDYLNDDGVRTWGGGNSILRCKIIDTKGSKRAHQDNAQSIPIGSEPNAQMHGAVSKGNRYIDNEFKSNGMSQCLFLSDGMEDGSIIIGNVCDTMSQHDISMCIGSGVIEDNVNGLGEPCRVVIDPLRIGAGHPLAFYVSSFSNGLEYKDIITNQPITDNRRIHHKKGKRYVDGFDWTLWRQICERVHYPHNGFDQHFRQSLAEYEHRTTRSRKMATPRTKIALTAGHDKFRMRGASWGGINENDFWNEFIPELIERSKNIAGIELRQFHRPDQKPIGYYKAMDRQHAKIDAWGANIDVELHFNSGNKATGHEVLHYSNSKGGRMIAEAMDAAFDKHLKNRDRGRKPVPVGGRGSYGLKVGKSKSIITEPFFGRELPNFGHGGAWRESLFNAYMDFFVNVAQMDRRVPQVAQLRNSMLTDDEYQAAMSLFS